MDKRVYDRSVCFTFFKEYYDHIESVKEKFGVEKAFDVLVAICEYALYKKEITDPEIKMLVGDSILSRIDESQRRRERVFR